MDVSDGSTPSKLTVSLINLNTQQVLHRVNQNNSINICQEIWLTIKTM